MKALLVLDMQNYILKQKSFKEEKGKIVNIIKQFKENGEPVIFTRHINLEDNNNPFYIDKKESEICEEYIQYADFIINKKTPSAFVETNLTNILKEKNIDHIIIVGFNTEFCCMFTAIAAYDRGYKVTFIEDAVGTINTKETYEMEGLNINDFVGSILNWSGVIEDLYYDEYKDIY